jgi:hypothetical protein
MQRTSPTMSVILREVEPLVSDLIELSMRHNLAYWGTMGAVPRGWARSASGDTAQGIAWIEEGIAYYRRTGSVLVMSLFPTQKTVAKKRPGPDDVDSDYLFTNRSRLVQRRPAGQFPGE